MNIIGSGISFSSKTSMSMGNNQIVIQQNFWLKVAFVLSLKSLPILLNGLTFFKLFYKAILNTHQNLVDGQL